MLYRLFQNLNYYDVNFTPIVSVVVRRNEDTEEMEIVGAEVDWAGSYANAWLLDKGIQSEEVSDGDESEHPAAAFGVEYVDTLIGGIGDRSTNVGLLTTLIEKMKNWRGLKPIVRTGG